jgi:PBP1b-binding outer membrane lipoprotein LpoB
MQTKKIFSAIFISILFFSGCGTERPADLTKKEEQKLIKMTKTKTEIHLQNIYIEYYLDDKFYRAKIIGKNLTNKFKTGVKKDKEKTISKIKEFVQKAESGNKQAKQQLQSLASWGALANLSKIKEIRDLNPRIKKILEKK